MFLKSYYCLLYKRTSKERRKGNPPTPTTSLYIQFVRYPRIILHASMYQPNNCSMILHTRKLFLSVQPRHNIRRRNTSSYVLISSLSSYIIPTPLSIPYIPLEPSSYFLLMSDLLSPGSCTSSRVPFNECKLSHFRFLCHFFGP
jgi:hypothetical protein